MLFLSSWGWYAGVHIRWPLILTFGWSRRQTPLRIWSGDKLLGASGRICLRMSPWTSCDLVSKIGADPGWVPDCSAQWCWKGKAPLLTRFRYQPTRTPYAWMLRLVSEGIEIWIVSKADVRKENQLLSLTGWSYIRKQNTKLHVDT